MGRIASAYPRRFMPSLSMSSRDKRLKKPLSLAEAVAVIEKYIKAGAPIIHAQTTQLFTFLELANSSTSRKKTFDLFLAATMKDNGIEGLYTINTADFQNFTFLKAVNPLA